MTADGTPTERYRRFLDGSKWKHVLAEAVREAYGDIFVLKAKPNNSDLQMITGKFKSTYNLSDVQADRAARTFLALLNLSDPEALYGVAKPQQTSHEIKMIEQPETSILINSPINGAGTGIEHVKPTVGLHYNIQIHLPATKDVEVYNAIFKSLRDHLID